MLDRYEATMALVGRLTDELVIGGIANPSFDLFLAGDRDRNFYTWGAMGLASSIGLGLALSSPGSKVVVLDGDGSLLMNLGTLATIGRYQPENLVHIIWDNAKYEATGGQETATGANTDLMEVAKACGIRQSIWANNLGDFEQAIERALSEPGPWTIGAKCGVADPTNKARKQAIEKLRGRFRRNDAFTLYASEGRRTRR